MCMIWLGFAKLKSLLHLLVGLWQISGAFTPAAGLFVGEWPRIDSFSWLKFHS